MAGSSGPFPLPPQSSGPRGRTVTVLPVGDHRAGPRNSPITDTTAARPPETIGYLLKDRGVDAATLLDALTRLVAGESVVDRRSSPKLMARSADLAALRLAKRWLKASGLGRALPDLVGQPRLADSEYAGQGGRDELALRTALPGLGPDVDAKHGRPLGKAEFDTLAGEHVAHRARVEELGVHVLRHSQSAMAVAHGSKFYSFTSCYSVGKIEKNQCDSWRKGFKTSK